MSYILDALKKAEAERRKEKVPGIHTQPVPAPAASNDTSPWQRPAIWIAAAAVAAALVATAWLKPWQTGPSPVQVALPPTPAAAPPVPAPTPAPTTAPAPVQAPLAPGVAPALPASGVPQNPSTYASASDTPRKPTQQHERKHDREPKMRTKDKAAAASPSQAEPAAPSLQELPEQIRREIPELKVGGYIYADKPADRSVLINNRLLHEGEEAAPGVTLERMQKNGLILRYKEYRFRKPY